MVYKHDWRYMKIILSRKGTDSGAGGIPGIILPNNEIIPLPIPGSSGETITYNDVKYNDDISIGDLINELTKNLYIGKDKIPFTKDIKCHMDPDLKASSYKREDNWRGTIGQIGAAQTVLKNANVQKGDIFIFFGWFQKTYYEGNKLKFCKGPGFHMIYGWLEIDHIIYTSIDNIPSWLQYHPHLIPDKIDDPNNCIYVGTKQLSLNNELKSH